MLLVGKMSQVIGLRRVIRKDLFSITIPILLIIVVSCSSQLQEVSNMVTIDQMVLTRENQALSDEKDSQRTVEQISDLATVYFYEGKYRDAENWYQKSLFAAEKTMGKQSYEAAKALYFLGQVYSAIHQDDKAESCLLKALSIQEKLGSSDPAVARTLYALGKLYHLTGRETDAERSLERAVAIQEFADGNDFAAAQYLNALIALYYETGQRQKAVPLFDRARSRNWGVVAQQAPIVPGDEAKTLAVIRTRAQEEIVAIQAQANASLQAQNTASHGKFKEAKQLFSRIFFIQDQFIQTFFNTFTEEEKLQFLQFVSDDYDRFLNMVQLFLRSDPEAIEQAFELVLRRKGIVLDVEARGRQFRADQASDSSKADRDDLERLRRDMGRLLLYKPKNLEWIVYRQQVVSLQQEIRSVEKRLARRHALDTAWFNQGNITIPAVINSLPKDPCLIEFVKIRDFDFINERWKNSQRYLAFVLSHRNHLYLMDLGEASDVERLAKRALDQIRSGDDSSIKITLKLLHELYLKIWQPVEHSVPDKGQCIISPDGVLNLVPFAALIDRRERPLIDKYTFAYVSSARTLLKTIKPNAELKPNDELLLIANPNYGQGELQAFPIPRGRGLRTFQPHFSPLPGTAREAEVIPSLVPGTEKTVLVGEQATEQAIKSALSPRILHLATHGFFMPKEELPLFSRRELGPAAKSVVDVEPLIAYESPLVRSGLALAGANQKNSKDEDGILTALEIAGMDLHRTDLVVLSACDTGVGDIQTGEGVFGLRRAFAVAGAKNLVMSMWKIGDLETVLQMQDFYQNLQTMRPASALRQMQLKAMKREISQHDFANPRTWAPFIIQGTEALDP
jgi:CHAT domain-containing protein